VSGAHVVTRRVSRPRYLWLLVREGAEMARTQWIVTTVTAFVIAAVSAVILATVGQTAAAEARVLARIDDAGTRTLVVSDPTGRAHLHADSLLAVGALAGVDWAIGLGPVVDVRNAGLGAAGQAVPARRLYGAFPSALEVIDGRPPAAREAIADQQALAELGMTDPAGGVTGESEESALVGTFVARDPLSFLDASVLILSESNLSRDSTEAAGHATRSDPLRQLVVAAERVDDVFWLSHALGLVVHADDTTQLRIDTPASLAQLRTLVEQELAASSRQLMLVILGVGLLLVMVTLAGAVAQRRRDFGRRRALGATRSAVVVLVLAQTAVAALLGVAAGTVAGLVADVQLAGASPPGAFTLGVAALGVLTALAAAVPPGLAAAFQDPVRILRVP
jgi:putative ABC transport system permease protein